MGEGLIRERWDSAIRTEYPGRQLGIPVGDLSLPEIEVHLAGLDVFDVDDEGLGQRGGIGARRVGGGVVGRGGVRLPG